MRIKVGEYIIEQKDKLNTVLSEIVTSKKGEQYEKKIGYYSNIEKAFKKALTLKIQNNQEIKDLTSCLKAINRAKIEIVAAIMNQDKEVQF